jgi:hypothetical protein
MNWKNYSRAIVFLILFTMVLAGCGIYSFSGVNITAETITIRDFYNDANNGPPDLAQRFSNEIKDYYQRNTNLTLVTEGGELIIDGAVVDYRLTPVAPQANQQQDGADLSAVTRLTIVVNVSYTNLEDDQFNFENRKFSFFADFNSDLNLTAVEDALIQEIYDQIILDIFNASVANW